MSLIIGILAILILVLTILHLLGKLDEATLKRQKENEQRSKDIRRT